MRAYSDWYNGIVKEIKLHQSSLSKRANKKYKLDLLMRVAERVASYSSMCGECQLLQPEITKLSQDLGGLVQISKERRQSYFKTLNNIIKHIRKHHKLVTEGQYMGIGLAVGGGIGTALGAALENPGAGTALGAVLGMVIGKYMENRARKEGRII